MNTEINTNTGGYISLAGIILSIAQHYNVSLDQSSIITLLAAFGIIYGWIHQWVVTRKVSNLAVAAGVKGIK